MAVVLPQGRLNNSSDKEIREFIAKRCRILAVVGLVITYIYNMIVARTYIEWLLEPLKAARPLRIEIVFRSETLAGDEVSVEITRGANGEIYHRVFSPEGKDHVVALSKA